MLKQIADRGGQAEAGFAPKYVRWAIWLSSEGQLLDVVPLGDDDSRVSRGRLFTKCPEQTQGELIAGGIPRSHFLVDTLEVVALLAPRNSAKAVAKHRYFRDLVRDANVATPELGVIAAAMDDPDLMSRLRDRLTELKAKPIDKATFRVGGECIVDSGSWHQWWRKRRQQQAAEADTSHREVRPMRCFITGDLVSPVPTHLKIRGLASAGGQASGDTLVSFDKEACRSDGLAQSSNAAVGEEAMTAYVNGLNELIRESQFTLAGARIVYWFERRVPEKNDPLPWLLHPEREEIDALALARDLLKSLDTGELVDLADNHFYALVLSGMAGRVMVRDWIYGQFDELAQNTYQWFEDLAVISPWGNSLARSPGMERVVACLLPQRQPGQKYEDWIKPAGAHRAPLWHAATKGAPIPFSAIARVTTVCRNLIIRGEANTGAAQSPSSSASVLQTRMGLIKAYHLRKARWEGDGNMDNQLTAALKENHPSPAYQCGRLLAVLAAIQRRALGDVGAGLVERYYASASSTPALVLGRLTRTSQYHLNKLEPGLAHWWDERVASIWNQLGTSVPQTLSLEDQSLFAMGYYHQLAQLRKRTQNATTETEVQS